MQASIRSLPKFNKKVGPASPTATSIKTLVRCTKVLLVLVKEAAQRRRSMPGPRLCQTAEQSLPGASGGATTRGARWRAAARGGDAEPLRARYVFGAVIARGVAADVVEATRTADGTRVAIKVLVTGAAAAATPRRLQRADSAALAAPESDSERKRQKPPPFREAVKRELLLQRALPFPQTRAVLHRHVNEVVLSSSATNYVVMEKAEGGTLLDVVATARRPKRSRRRASAQIDGALSFLHARGQIHRDLKLENVLVGDADGPLHVLLCDFGSARFSSTSATNGKAATAHVGTLPYMAPEQRGGRRTIRRLTFGPLGSCSARCASAGAALSRVRPRELGRRRRRDDLPRDASSPPCSRRHLRVPAAAL